MQYINRDTPAKFKASNIVVLYNFFCFRSCLPKFLLNFPKWRLTQHRSVHKSSPNSHKSAPKLNKLASVSPTLDCQAQVQVHVG